MDPLTPQADLAESLPGVFHNWQSIALTPPAAGDFSFGLEAEEIARWEMDLPSDPQQADELLAQSEAQVVSADRLLQEAPARLDQVIASAAARGSGPISFSLPAETAALPPAESELLAWLQAAQPETVAFGLPALPGRDILDASAQVQQALAGMLQQVVHLAWVETRQNQRTLGRSVVNWGGDTDTVWEPELPPEQLSLHRRSLGLAVSSRLALLRLILTVTQGAAKISVLIAAPGANLLALPAAWKFVNRLLAEIETYKSIRTSAQET